MLKAIRKKIWIEIRDTHGNWKPVYGYYPKEWLCALPECNRATKASNRVISRRNRSTHLYCSSTCRAIHQGRLRRVKKSA